MREIKFRGKRIDKGEWVHGCLTRYSDYMCYITEDLIENEVYQVKTETVGQYTALKDKNGKEIYEGDIVTLSYNTEHGLKVYTRTIIFESGMFLCACESGSGASLYSYATRVKPPIIEVIGNIYDQIWRKDY